MRVKVDDEYVSEAIVEELLEQLSMIEDHEEHEWLTEAFHRVIAYNSVPGQYEEGKYDNKG